ncbi:MAG TPA: tRNA (adenosine(37)-N6)-threonylcarbamoyltransferase complex dimerization subunit type 1 TsaB [Gemmatimonadaceae bacterium]|nr:tRNA (adenosine(37)-N6)-threonylcarbamoyltransferase complex dimerization subunit type 1 TsaB [Gemmatimonadaceae bacterium]
MSGVTLALDASTYTASVALVQGDRVVREATVAMRDPRHERLMPAVADTLGTAGMREVGRIVCGAGPGSFTSLRIAASIAKGLAVASGTPLFAVSSLALLIAGTETAPPTGRWLCLLDAMRGEAFAQAFEVASSGAISEASDVRVVREEEVPALARAMQARTIGLGREAHAVPHARGVLRLATHASLQSPVDLASWEPDYGRLAEAQVRWEAAHGRALDGRSW